MNITKTYISAVIAALVIATATTTSAFPSVAVLATLLTASEQAGNSTTTNATSTAGPQAPIYITKHGTNSYAISGAMSSVGSFDTTYRIVGETSAIKSAENLIITTIVSDYSSSPTIGYVTVANTTMAVANATTTLPNPFASPQQIAEKITNELRGVISETENNTSQGQHVEIKCGFGMTLEDMRCHYIPLLAAAQE